MACTVALVLTGVPLMLIPKPSLEVWHLVEHWSWVLFSQAFSSLCRVQKRRGQHPERDGFWRFATTCLLSTSRSCWPIPGPMGSPSGLSSTFPEWGRSAIWEERCSLAPKSRCGRRVLREALVRMKAGAAARVPSGLEPSKKPKVHTGLIVACHSAGIPVVPTASLIPSIWCPTMWTFGPFDVCE